MPHSTLHLHLLMPSRATSGFEAPFSPPAPQNNIVYMNTTMIRCGIQTPSITHNHSNGWMGGPHRSPLLAILILPFCWNGIRTRVVCCSLFLSVHLVHVLLQWNLLLKVASVQLPCLALLSHSRKAWWPGWERHSGGFVQSMKNLPLILIYSELCIQH